MPEASKGAAVRGGWMAGGGSTAGEADLEGAHWVEARRVVRVAEAAGCWAAVAAPMVAVAPQEETTVGVEEVAMVAVPSVAVQGAVAAGMVEVGREVALMVVRMVGKVEAEVASRAAELVEVETAQAMWEKVGARVEAVETVCMAVATVACLEVREAAMMVANMAVAVATGATTEAQREAGPMGAKG